MSILRAAPVRLLAILLLAGTALGAAAQPHREDDIARLRALLESPDEAERIRAAKELWDFSGITEPTIHAIIAARLRSGDLSPATDQRQEFGWYAKALASSGDPAHLPLLQKIADPPPRSTAHTIQRAARQAVDALPQFTEWNRIINSEAGHRPGESWTLTRTRNMLASGVPELARGALRLLKTQPEARAELYAIAAEQFDRIDLAAAEAAKDVRTLDHAGWLLRALGESGDPQYEPRLRRVLETAQTRKLRQGAKVAWESYGRARAGTPGGDLAEESDEASPER